MRLRRQAPPEPEIVVEYMNAGVRLLEAVVGNRFALAYVDSLGVIERHTYGEVVRDASRWADLMPSRGLERSDRAVVLGGLDRDWRSALLGVLLAGGVAVPYPADAATEDIQEIAADCGAVLFASAHARPELADRTGLPVVTAAELGPYAEAKARRTVPDDVALILYTRADSQVDGAMHTHASLLAHAEDGRHRLDFEANDRVWCMATDGSIESTWFMLAAWRAGAELVVVDYAAEPDAELELLDRLHLTATWFSEDKYVALASAGVPKWADLGSIRRVLTSDATTEGATAFADLCEATVAPVELGEFKDGVEIPLAVEDAVSVAAQPTSVPEHEAERMRAEEEERQRAEEAARAEAQRRAGEEKDARRREEEQQAKEREKAEKEERRRAEEAARIEARRHAEEEKEARRREEERAKEREEAEEADRLRAEEAARAAAQRRAQEEKEARRREEQQAKEREKAEKEERRRAEEAARAEAQRRAREEKEARRSEEQLAKERQKAEEEERRRAEDEKRREEQRRREEEKARSREEEQAKELEKAEKRRLRDEEKNRELAERAAATERKAAEEAARAEEEKRGEQERREAEKRAQEDERARRKAEEAEERRRAKEAARADNGRRRRGQKQHEPDQPPPPEHLTAAMLSRISEYGVSAQRAELDVPSFEASVASEDAD